MVSSVPEIALVGGHEGLVVRQRVDVDRLAVDVDQRDIGGGGGIRHGLGGRGVDGVDDDRVHARRDEILDLVKLLCNVVLRVLHLDLDAVHALGLLDHAVTKDGQEIVIEQRHRHADLFGEGRRRHEHRDCGAQQILFHFTFLHKVGVRWRRLSGTSCIQEALPKGSHSHRQTGPDLRLRPGCLADAGRFLSPLPRQAK